LIDATESPMSAQKGAKALLQWKEKAAHYKIAVGCKQGGWANNLRFLYQW